MNHHDPSTDPSNLLNEATADLAPDVDRLVAGGIARGRTLRRRRRVGAVLAAAAVIGVTGAAASLAPALGHGGGGVPVAGSPSASPTVSTSVPPSTSPSVNPSVSEPPINPSTSTPPDDGTTTIAVAAEDVPTAFEELLGRSGAGALRLEPPYGAASDGGRLVAHFSWRGTLTTFLIEPYAGDGQAACQQSVGPTGGTCSTDEAGHPMLLWGPTLGDGVEAQGATVWRDGFEVSALSYNAAEGKNSPPLFPHPPLTMDDLSLLAASDSWFS